MALLPRGCTMEPWITYWYQVLTACIDWVIVYYPIPTIFFGIIVTGAMVIGFWSRGQKAEASSIVWGFLFGLIACFVSFVVLFLSYGPYLHLQKREKELQDAAAIKYSTMETSKNSQIKTLNDVVAVLSESPKTLQDKEQIAKENREKVIAKLCFHSPLAFTQTRLDNFQGPSEIIYEYAKEIMMKPFSFSGPTTVRIHVNGGVSWFHTTPRDNEFERFNGGVSGHDYVEIPVSSKVLKEKHWSITLYGQKPFDVICIDRLPKKPEQAAIHGKPKEKLADVLIRKYPAPTEMERFPEHFIRYWLAQINNVRTEGPRPSLQKVIREMGRPTVGGPTMKEIVAEATFILRCLESEGYIHIGETISNGEWLGNHFPSFEFEFVPEKLDEFKEGL